MRTWTSPNGVDHLVPAHGPCATCGVGRHTAAASTGGELSLAELAVTRAGQLRAAVAAAAGGELADWEDVYSAADHLQDIAADLRRIARKRGGADWLRAERSEPASSGPGWQLEVATEPREGIG